MSTSLFESEEGRRAGQLLEYPSLLNDVARHCALARARRRLAQLTPIRDRDALQHLWARVSELMEHLAASSLPLGDFADLEILFGEERSERGPLEPAALAAVAGAASEMGRLRLQVEQDRDRIPLVAAMLSGHFDPLPLADHLHAALEPDGRIRDSASPRLGALRQAVRSRRSRLREIAQRRMTDALKAGWTTADELTLRGDRYCVPLRARDRGRIGGIVHDRSSTGHTLFVEPIEVVEVGNELQEALLEVEDEERRIVAALNQQLSIAAAPLLALFAVVVELDLLAARARWGLAHRGWVPELLPAAQQHLKLMGFRHPLLEDSLRRAGNESELVPLDLDLDPASRVLLISGPNAGGKTVALKAVGLAVLMAQSGLPLPAETRPRLPIFDAVLMDVGDEQSIADALSSFSAHLTHLRNILEEAHPGCLVLLDEVGAGTDPQEGVALARALLEQLAEAGARCLVTTHYGQLKVLVETNPGFRNASMAYDQQELRPRFALQLDLPGSSHALEMAERLGLPPALLDRARSLVGDDRLRLDRLLRDLEEERQRAAALREEAEPGLRQLRAERARYEERSRELKQRRRESLDEAEREAAGILRNARRRVERLLGEILASPDEAAARVAARRAREEIEERSKLLEQRLRARDRRRGSTRPARLEEGAQVRHLGLDQVGSIVQIRGRRVTLEIGGRRVVVRPEELVDPGGAQISEEGGETRGSRISPADRPGGPPAQEGGIRAELDEEHLGVSRVDVRGLDSVEAWMAVDKTLDRCLLSGVASIEIIHGKGTGRLRESLSRRLAADPRVRRAGVGGWGRFDEGVTVVEL